MRNAIAECCFCDMPMTYVLPNERATRFDCTHTSHYKCLLQLAISIKDLSDCRKLTCGTCDAEISISDPKLADKFEMDLAKDLPLDIARFASAKTSGTTEEVHEIQEPEDEPVHTLKKCIFTESPSQLDKIESSIQISGDAVKNSDCYSCLVSLCVPDGIFYSSTYTGEDELDKCVIKHTIETQSFRGVRLLDMGLGSIRYTNNYIVSADMVSWKVSTCFLFANVLVVARTVEDRLHVKATIDLRTHLESLQFQSRMGKRVLMFKLNCFSLPKLYFCSEDETLLDVLCAAIYDPLLKLQVRSLTDRDTCLSVPYVSGSVCQRLPISLILCLQRPESPEDSEKLVHALNQVRSSLSVFDKLALVISDNSKVPCTTFSLRKPTWEGWNTIISSIGTVNSNLPQYCDLTSVLENAESLLVDHQVNKATAVVALLSSHQMHRLRSVPNAFIYSHTPVYTFGIGSEHDSTALNSLACKTAGGYEFLPSYDFLEESMLSFVKAMHSFTHKSVEVQVSASKGASIQSIQGVKMESFTEEFLGSFKGPVSECSQEPLRKSDGSQTITLGNLKQGEYRSFIVNFTGEPEGDELCSVRVGSRPMDSTSSRFHYKSEVVKLSTSSHILIAQRQMSVAVMEKAKAIIIEALRKDYKGVFFSLLAPNTFQDCLSSFNRGDLHFELVDHFYKTCERMFTQLCDQILLPNRSYTLLINQLMNMFWVLKREQPSVAASQWDEFYRY